MENNIDAIQTVGVLLFKRDQVLLVKHTNKSNHVEGFYGLPAGRVKGDENGSETAVRKLYEESGLITKASDLQLLSNTYTAKIKTKSGLEKFVLTIYLCMNYEGSLSRSEREVPEWVKINDINQKKLLPNVDKIINDYRGELK